MDTYRTTTTRRPDQPTDATPEARMTLRRSKRVNGGWWIYKENGDEEYLGYVVKDNGAWTAILAPAHANGRLDKRVGSYPTLQEAAEALGPKR